MANQWALLIGINQYTALQPLMYAQADAVALRNFFVDELGIPIERCMLLTDMSAAIEPYAHYPLRKEVVSQLQTLCREQVQPGDLLWVFFSGYGLANGGQDYWMPIDADPTRLKETAIAVTEIFDILKAAKTDQILLVLDVNRSQGAVGHQNIGQQTLTLAHDFGIATLMSCQPEQYAHETMAVRHGLFTKALLEGLRYHGCVTVSHLAAYVSDRVPELSQHHWRPEQTPATVIPAARKFMMVIPPEGIASLPMTETAAANLTVSDFPAETASRTSRADAPNFSETAPPENETVAAGQSTAPAPTAQIPAPMPSEGTPASTEGRAPGKGAIIHTPEPEATAAGGGNLWRWGIAAALLAFLVGVGVRFQPELFGQREADDAAPPSADPAATPTVDSEAATEPAPDAEATPPAAATDTTETAPTGDGAALFPETVDPAAAGESALQRAEAAIANNRYGEAQAWLSQVPPELQNETYETLVQQANNEVAQSAVRNQAILESARQSIQPLSASLFNDAIEQARQVPPGDPYYEQAQADIARWSRVILDLAEGRATTGNISGAIAAAQLVPEDQPAVYQQAQQRIATWQQQLDNQQLIRQAQSTLQPGQASSFQDAIITLQQITPDQPGFTAAQERINQWSQDILAISRARAAQGRFESAIAAANLVPEETAAYSDAQQEIQRWQSRLQSPTPPPN